MDQQIKQRHEINRIKKLAKKRKRWLDYIKLKNSGNPLPESKKIKLWPRELPKKLTISSTKEPADSANTLVAVLRRMWNYITSFFGVRHKAR